MAGSDNGQVAGTTAEVREGVLWLAKVVALFDIANERAGLELCIDREAYLKNPRLGIYFWRMECESRALPRIEPEAYREELRELLASVLVDYSWEHVQRKLDDDELEILREEYGRYKRTVEAGLRR